MLRTVLLLLAACSDGPVRGRVVEHFLAPSDLTTGPDRTGSTYRAYVHAGDSWVTSGDVHGTTSGTFEIGDLPDGPYVLRTTSRRGFVIWSDHADRDVTFAFTGEGRPDAEPLATTEDGPIELAVAGIHFGDRMQLVDWGNGGELDLEFTPPTSPVPWGKGYSYGDLGPDLVQPSRGDSLVLYRRTTDGGNPLVSRLAQLANLTTPGDQQHGAPLIATGTFTDVPPETPFTMSIDLDAFATAFGGIPDTASVRWEISVIAGPAVAHDLDQGPTLLDVTDSTHAGRVTVTVPLPAVFDPSWDIAVVTVFEIATVNGGVAGSRAIVPRSSDSFTAVPPVALPGTATLDGLPFDDRAVTAGGFVLAVAGADGFTADLEVQHNGRWFFDSWIQAAGDQIALPPEVFAPMNVYSFLINEHGVYTRTPPFVMHP